jgi:4-amino-4-deoxy-L-arabinose transferase-like glycosyltransferase
LVRTVASGALRRSGRILIKGYTEGTVSPTPDSPVFPADPGSARRWRLLEPALIGALALTLNLLGNGRVSLWDRDEPRYAACVREMRARGDWILPTFNGEPRYQKPVLIYWLMRAGVALGGDNPFGARLVSAFAGMGTCLLVWSLGRRMLGERAGRLGALMLATSPIMVIESKLATTDATLAFWLVGAQFCLWELTKRPSRWFAAGFWILMALATLTKGPVGIALIAVSGLVSWWWGGPTECWKRLHWRAGLPALVLITAPWFVAVGIASHGDFFRIALGQQVIYRVTSGMEEHAGFPGYYLLTMLGLFHPWSALLPAAALAAWFRRRMRPEFGFLLGWMIGPLIFLECVRTKLVHYYLPAIPACALLAAWLIVALVQDEVNLRRWTLGRLGVGLLGGTALVLAVVLAAGAVVMPSDLRWPLLALALVLVPGTLYGLERFHRGATERAVHALIATWGLLLFAIAGWLLPAAEPYRTPRLVAERLAVLSKTHHAQPALHSYQEPSTIYAYGQPVPTVRKWWQIRALVATHGTVVTALLPHELKEFLKKPYLEVEVLDSMTGFNLNKGVGEKLHFILVRESRSARAARLEQTLVE